MCVPISHRDGVQCDLHLITFVPCFIPEEQKEAFHWVSAEKNQGRPRIAWSDAVWTDIELMTNGRSMG